MLRRLAPAKINLALHVTGQRADGYHLLDSLVCFADFGDILSVEMAESLSLKVTGRMAAHVPDGPENLILKAAGLFAAGHGAHIELQKNLPVASGIGGGSSDAAAALHLLSAAWGEPLPNLTQMLALGADVPVCVVGETVQLRGIGEDLTPVKMPVFSAVLVNPGVGLSTQKVFQLLESKDNTEMQPPPQSMDLGAWLTYLRAQRNDLEPVAISCAPEIALVLDALAACKSCNLARMSGSGATCFGLFPHREAAVEATAIIEKNHADWWVKTVHLG